MAYSFDGLNLNDGSTYITVTAPQMAGAVRQATTLPYGARPGGRWSRMLPGAREIALSGFVKGASASALESALDTLKKTLARPRRRLVASHQDSRYWTASCQSLAVDSPPGWGGKVAAWSAVFVCEDPFALAPTHSADVRTPTLALAPGETTVYRLQYSLTPGGTMPAPMRTFISVPNAGVTPVLWQLSNLSTLAPLRDHREAPVRVATSATVAGGSVLVLDGERGEVWASTMANVEGWWPMEESAGSLQDFSGNAANLSATGTPSYRADGENGPCIDYNGTDSFHSSPVAALRFSGSFSIGAWVYADVADTNMGIMMCSDTTAYDGYALRKTSGNVILAEIGDSAAARRQATGTTTLSATRWYHVVATFNATTDQILIYLDGELEAASTTGAFAQSVAGTFYVGVAYDISVPAVHYWNGRIREAFAVGAVMTQAQIRAAMIRHLPAALGTQQSFSTRFPELDPRVGTTNLIEIRADHGTSTPTMRLSSAWRSRYD